MGLSYSPVPGKLSAVIYGGDSPNNPGGRLPFNAYSWDGSANLIDVTGSGCTKFMCFDDGLKHMSLLLVGVWDANRNPFTVAPTFKLGSKVSGLIMKVHGAVQAYTSKAIVTNFKAKAVANGLTVYLVELTAAWQFNDYSGNPA